MFNYDFIEKENLGFLKTYQYKGVDKSLLYNYVFSPFANYCLKYVPLSVAPNMLTLYGLACIVIPHLLFLFVMGYGPFEGDVPTWLLWVTVVLHLAYMNFDNLDGKQARRTKNSSPLGMILDHNFDSMIVMIQCTNLATTLQFGSSIYSFILYSMSSIPFYIIAHEEYYTHEMNLPIVNPAAEGTFSIALFFAGTAIYGCNIWIYRLPWFYDMQFNHAFMITYGSVIIFGLPFVFQKIQKFIPLKTLFYQLKYLLFAYFVVGYTIYFSQINVASTHMRSILYLIGFTMSKAVGIVSLYHVSNQKLPQYLNSIYIFVLIWINSIIGQIFGQTLINEGHLLMAMAFLSFLIHLHFLYNILMDINLNETLLIIVGAAISISIAEFLSWYLVYRTQDYLSLVSRIETAVIKYNKEKEQFVKETNAKNQEKKVAQLEAQLKAMNQEMTMMKMKSNIAIALLSIITINSIGNYYSGIVVAKLPFEPISFLQNVTHRGINGEDPTDCSYIFIYILSALIFRANIQKLFGFEGPKMPFGPAGPQQSMFAK